MLLPLWGKESNNYRYCDRWKSDNFRNNNQEKKQRADTKKGTKIKSDNFTWSNREKAYIAIVILKTLIIG